MGSHKHNLFNFIYPTLSLNRGRTIAIRRVGTHNIEVLSIIICNMLASTKNYLSYSGSAHAMQPLGDNSKKIRLKNFEKKRISLSKNLEEILIGLLLGDVYAQKRTTRGNANLHFEQGIGHKEYLFHLFELFKHHCRSEPRISDRLPDKRTGKIYTRVQFITYSLPCFNELYFSFYPKGKKTVPLNIEERLTLLGLVYWICDDGSFCKKHKYIRLATNSYTLQEIDLLLGILKNKFDLSCYAIQDRSGYVITISARSVIALQPLLKPIMPSMMMHKIGM